VIQVGGGTWAGIEGVIPFQCHHLESWRFK
jgi:hypothetical protein